MEKIREAMELALSRHWDAQAASPPAASRVSARPAFAMRVAERVFARLPSAEPQRAVAAAVPPIRRGSSLRIVAVDAETLRRHRLVAALKDDARRAQYCLLQAAVSDGMARGMQVLGVTGPRSGRGKTVTAANLAICLAKASSRPVVLLDLDLADPTLHRLFEVEAAPGVEGCLFDGAGIADALLCPSIEGLSLLPARGGCSGARQILQSTSLRALIGSLRTLDPDVTIVADLPAIAADEDAEAFAALVDGLLLVVEDGVTRAADYRLAVTSIRKGKLMGTVLNNAGSTA